MTYTIIHNPRCAKSREGLKYLEEKGIEFKIREYLKENQNPIEEELIEWMIKYPKLIERPIIINEKSKKAVIARPTEKIDAIL